MKKISRRSFLKVSGTMAAAGALSKAAKAGVQGAIGKFTPRGRSS